jgi:TRAP-type C4-dicarboxylate transport system permease small subunit
VKNLYFRLIHYISVLENIFCFSALLICSALVVAQVINRYLLHYEIMWLGDLALYLFVPFLIYSIVLTTREQHHTSVDIFLDIAFENRPTALKIYKIVLNIAVLLILIYLIPMAYELFLNAVKYPKYGTLVTWFNSSWTRELVLIAFILCMFHTLHHIAMQVGDVIKIHRSGE